MRQGSAEAQTPNLNLPTKQHWRHIFIDIVQAGLSKVSVYPRSYRFKPSRQSS